jgi:hypothetical protein
MTGEVTAMSSHRGRIVLLWICVALFFLRVVGQLEALLLSPAWLPSMEQWYSGLVPYVLLLPSQIVILMFMAVLVVREQDASQECGERSRWRHWIRRFALGYFAAMVVRLLVQFTRGADDVITAGGIPVAFHWVLALFLLVLSRVSVRQGSHPWR